MSGLGLGLGIGACLDWATVPDRPASRTRASRAARFRLGKMPDEHQRSLVAKCVIICENRLTVNGERAPDVPLTFKAMLWRRSRRYI